MISGRAYGAMRGLLFALSPETAHGLALAAIRTGAFADRRPDDPVLSIDLWDRPICNPLGLAAGFDKNAVCLRALCNLGFGFIEVGGVTPRPQVGNPRPRIFRDINARAIINRCGLNNDGLDRVLERLRSHRSNVGKGGIPIAVNLGPNSDSGAPSNDYSHLARQLSPVADMLVINVSSPNTVGLRNLQATNLLADIIDAIEAALPSDSRPKILVKLTSDMPSEALEELAEFAVNRSLDGLSLCNTTVTRPPGLPIGFAKQKGGLSGAPLKELSLAALQRVAKITAGRVPLIGIGGIETGQDAYCRIRAGASLIQLYSALVFDGPGVIAKVKVDLAGLLRADGFSHVADAVGVDAY